MAKESLKKMLDAVEASKTAVFCVDAEFNSYKGELISIALVGVDGREFYAELPLPPTINGWVKDNVVPLLEFEKPLSLSQLQEDLESFLRPYTTIHIVADWPDDIKYFCDVLITAPVSASTPHPSPWRSVGTWMRLRPYPITHYTMRGVFVTFISRRRRKNDKT